MFEGPLTSRQNDAWNKVAAGAFAEAAEEFARLIEESESPHIALFANKAIAETHAGNFGEAETTLRQGQRSLDERASPSSLMDRIAVAEWLQGKKRPAVETLLEAIERLRDGRTQYADPTGGAEEGFLLFYFAVTLRDQELRSKSNRWLKHLWDRGRLQSWPGPLVFWFFEDIDDAALISTAARVAPDQARAKATTDILARRKLVEAYFLLGTRHRDKGDERGARRWFQTAADLPSPLVGYWWSLARDEATSAS